MEIFDVFSMNGIENYPAAGEFFLENVILSTLAVALSRVEFCKTRDPITYYAKSWTSRMRS